MILNLEKPAARQAITHPESSWWLRAGAEIPVETIGTVGQSAGKGNGSDGCKAPAAPFRQIGPVPFFGQPQGAFETAGNLLPDSGIEVEGR
jgi:hypothetical protein